MVGLLVILGITLFVGCVFWYGLRGQPNEEPVIGHNWPYPTSLMPPVGYPPELVEEDEETGHESPGPET